MGLIRKIINTGSKIALTASCLGMLYYLGKAELDYIPHEEFGVAILCPVIVASSLLVYGFSRPEKNHPSSNNENSNYSI